MKTYKASNKLSLNGVCYEKRYKIWCVTSTRIMRAHRRIYQRFFDDGKAALKFMEGIDRYFRDNNPEAELTKTDFLQAGNGEVRKSNRTYTFGNNPWDKQIFHLKMVPVLDFCDEADGTETANTEMTTTEMREELSALNFSKEYIDSLDDDQVSSLYDEQLGEEDDDE